ncbi:MAG: hypothetical protein SGI88_01020 [Candidatus Hydrogenedentes bacterium]|nr:hypothetical protein [Candidatus Hydrogenedentota bacterium]
MDRFDWLELDSTPGIAQTRRSSQKEPAAALAMPNDSASFYRAAREMRAAGHFRAATEFYRKATALNDHHFDAWAELIDTLVRARRMTEAASASQEAHEAFKQVRLLYASRALVLAHQGNFQEAMRYSDVSVDAAELSWYARSVRGELQLKMNPAHRNDALASFEQAMQMARHAWEPAFLAGWVLLDAKHFALAAGFLAEAAHQRPRAPLLWLCLGDCFRELKFYEQALFYYQRVTELEPASEIALARQKECGSLVYGLMRALSRDSLQKRWRRDFDRLLGRD